ncbi:MAG: ATPase [Gemmatimonadota bacterium]|nr:ATPase [Gemmatimonadota bacterium]
MSASHPTIVLCLASYFKGAPLLRECKALGCRVLLLTVTSLQNADWPRESIDELFVMPDLYRRDDVMNAVSYLIRSEAIDRIIPLDEFDLEMAAALREHLRVPGMGETTVRYFRDKLAMRVRARTDEIAVPQFAPLLNRGRIDEFIASVKPPWLMKPRFSASAIGIKKIDDASQLWRTMDELGDEQSLHLLEEFVPGDVFHVDAITWEKEIVFAEASGYVQPPFDVYHHGGLFATRMLDRDSDDARALVDINRAVLTALGYRRGVTHTEFIRSKADGRVFFLETAARVGGANIVDMIEAGTGINLWREWARLEVADARKEDYVPPASRGNYAGMISSLARQEWPDTAGYSESEIVWRLNKRHHVGLIVAAPTAQRVDELVHAYLPRIQADFHASMPAPETPFD